MLLIPTETSQPHRAPMRRAESQEELLMAPTWVKGGKSWGDPDQGPLSLPCPLGIMCAVCAGYITLAWVLFAVACMILGGRLCEFEV